MAIKAVYTGGTTIEGERIWDFLMDSAEDIANLPDMEAPGADGLTAQPGSCAYTGDMTEIRQMTPSGAWSVICSATDAGPGGGAGDGRDQGDGDGEGGER